MADTSANTKVCTKVNCFDPNHEILVLNAIMEEYQVEEMVEFLDEDGVGTGEFNPEMVTKKKPSREKIEFLLGFNPNSYANESLIQPYAILQKFDFDVLKFLRLDSLGPDERNQLPCSHGQLPERLHQEGQRKFSV